MQKLENKVVEEKLEGFADGGAMITLILGVGVAVLLLIFIGVMGGQAYSITEPQINAINDTTIRGHVKDSITQGFFALRTTSQYLPIVVLAVIIGVVLGVIFGVLGATQRTAASAL